MDKGARKPSEQHEVKKGRADVDYLGTMGGRVWGAGMVEDTGLELSNWVSRASARGK